MTSSKAMGIVFPNLHDQNIPELIGRRTMASLPFAGRYRMIDFCLSGFANAGIQNIGIIVRQNYQSLMDHLGNGREWDLSSKRGGLVIFPPNARDSNEMYRGRIEALNSIMDYLSHRKEELVVMSDCDTACNFDYTALIAKHRSSGADITVVYEKSEIPEALKDDNVTFAIDDQDNITQLRINDYKSGEKNISMDMYVIRRELLISIVKEAVVCGDVDFEKECLPRALKSAKVKGYEYTGYRAHIYDMMSFFNESLRLLEDRNIEKLFPEDSPIYTKVRDSAPVRYAIGSKVANSLIGDGCIIEGEVENCVLFREVRVGKGAKLKNSIVMQGSIVAPNAQLENVITDKNVVVSEGQTLRGAASFPVFIAKGVHVK